MLHVEADRSLENAGGRSVRQEVAVDSGHGRSWNVALQLRSAKLYSASSKQRITL